MNSRNRIAGLISVLALLGVVGCTKDNGPVSPAGNPQVALSVSFSSGGSGTALMKAAVPASVDSLRIDSAIVVFDRIKFESHIDTVAVDSTGSGSDDDRDANVTFRGPFVVHIRDTVAISFADQTLPPGTYDGIKFKIHRLQPGEPREDSDEHNGHHPGNTDSLTYGSSVMVWGSVFKNGAWVPFTLTYDGELEFKIKGNFVVSAATNNINIALNFNMGLWFTDPHTGALLDPTDTSMMNRELFREAIRHSFETGRGGRDRDHDGHPDD